MNLLEILAEGSRPGPVGDIEFQKQVAVARRSKVAVVLRGLVAFGTLLGWLFVTCWGLARMDVFAIAIILVVTYGYLWAGYHVHPRPDDRNLGLLGGLINHPLRYTDNLNRLLVALWLFLLPGRFIAESLMEILRGRSDRPPSATSLRHL
jgi:hypothetical protein